MPTRKKPASAAPAPQPAPTSPASQPPAAPARKLRVGILFGGRSGEHEVSLLSAASILHSIDRNKYDVVPIGITRDGHWVTATDAEAILAGTTAPRLQEVADPLLAGDPQRTAPAAVLRSATEPVVLPPMPGTPPRPGTTSLSHLPLPAPPELDIIFPVLHGTFGEDGTIQGLLELAGIPYVGSGVLGSAAGMDKIAMKQIFAAAGLPQTPWLPVLRSAWQADPEKVTRHLEKHLQYPLFVKPANLGSSVGISKVHDRSELAEAMNLAANYDRRLIVEQGVGGPGSKPRELEVAILGNDQPTASPVGEIIPGAEFYSYESKYHSDASVPVIPANLSPADSKRIRKLALQAFQSIDAAGLARVDFLMEPLELNKHGKPKRHQKPARIFLNEINTLPGFTSISMYPKLWQAAGISYPDLIDQLLTLALTRHAERQLTTFSR